MTTDTPTIARRLAAILGAAALVTGCAGGSGPEPDAGRGAAAASPPAAQVEAPASPVPPPAPARIEDPSPPPGSASYPEEPVPAFQWTMEFPPALGEPLGRIRIPKAGVDWPVVYGVNPEHLRIAPGLMPRTAMPGQFGNSAIAGHRTTYGAPFYHVDRLEPGDEIHVDTGIGTHTYEVISTEIVLPTAMWTVQHRAGGWLTLIACHPKGSAAQRIIVFARIVDGPNLAGIDAAYSGPYLPPQDPDTAVTRRHHAQIEPPLRHL
jgi:LPXTG-site transpeptidase (sortase) family protein